MQVVAIIPARYASTRLPGKPLLRQTGKPLIQHVVEAVRSAKRVDRIIVATDDGRIAEAVAGFGAEAIMTGRGHTCGTDRIAEAAEKLGLDDDDIVVNVQADEPETPGAYAERLIELLNGSDAPMATLAAPITPARAGDPDKVKVVCDSSGHAVYFSRAPIPYDRDAGGAVEYLGHLGLYAYRAAFLKVFAALPPTPAEKAEKLEQLRALEHGYRIAVAVVEHDQAGIDTPEDYAAFVERIKNLKPIKEA